MRLVFVLVLVAAPWSAGSVAASTATDAASVTLFARPTVVDRTPVTVFGSIDSGKAGESVTIQAKDCGSEFFRVFSGTTTRAGGGFSTVLYPGVNTELRAVWNDASSAEVAIRRRATVYLDRLRQGPGFRVGVGARRSFWRKKVVIQRRAGTSWRPLKTVVLSQSRSGGTPNSGSWSESTFTVAVPKGTLIRAVMPHAEAKPCYLGGVSRTVRA
jgi:hypothetical protein